MLEPICNPLVEPTNGTSSAREENCNIINQYIGEWELADYSGSTCDIKLSDPINLCTLGSNESSSEERYDQASCPIPSWSPGSCNKIDMHEIIISTLNGFS